MKDLKAMVKRMMPSASDAQVGGGREGSDRGMNRM